jgi:ribonuclease BN (tRNA processing enzyme)
MACARIFFWSRAIPFLGGGDAFGSGGRLQTCILVTATTSTLLVDCGATALIAVRRFGVNPNDIDLILLTHLHGDHFGGIPFVVLDAQLISKRSRPLVIAGLSGTQRRIAAAMEVLFPGSSQVPQHVLLDIHELVPEQPSTFDEVTITPYPVQHSS